MGFFSRLFRRKKGGTRAGNLLRNVRDSLFFGILKRRSSRR